MVIQPSGNTTRIRRIQSHGRDVETSGPGTRTALNLADANADSATADESEAEAREEFHRSERANRS